MFKKSAKILFLLAGFSLCLAFLAWHKKTENLRLCFFDVGQGDAIFLRTPEGQNVLIDGGPDNAILSKLGKELPFYDRTIDLLVLTHSHADHIVGLLEVLKKYQIKKVLETSVFDPSPQYQAWQAWLEKRELKTWPATAGQQFILSGLKLTVLYPLRPLAKEKFDNLNDASIAVKAEYFNSAVILTGDLESKGETELIGAWGNFLKADILKAGHHGSNTASSLEFLKTVNPGIVVIQLGVDNAYNFPSAKILQSLKFLHIPLYRTDQDGDVCFSLSQQGIGKP